MKVDVLHVHDIKGVLSRSMSLNLGFWRGEGAVTWYGLYALH